jgi:hypothetical protein
MKKRLSYTHLALTLSLVSVCLYFMLPHGIVSAQSGCTPPPTNGQWWAPNTEITVWVDPSFQQQANFTESTSVNAALGDWFRESSLQNNHITYVFAAPGTPMPAANAPNTIRVLNDPSGSPNNLAYTTTTVHLDSNGNSTGQMNSATIYFNRGFTLASGAPAYDPHLTDAQLFLESVFDHELGHAFGLSDTPAPNDANGHPNSCLQTPGANVMNGYCGTNDQGSNGSPGVRPNPNTPNGSITPCDNNQTGSAEAAHGGVTAQNGTGTGSGVDGDSLGGSGDVWDFNGWWDEFDVLFATSCTPPPCDWNDETFTLTCYYC